MVIRAAEALVTEDALLGWNVGGEHSFGGRQGPEVVGPVMIAADKDGELGAADKLFDEQACHGESSGRTRR